MGGPPPPTVNAAEQLNIPAILLIVGAGLAILMHLFGLVAGGSTASLAKYVSDPKIRDALMQSQQASGGQRIINFFTTFLFIGLDGLMIFGALQMRQLKSWGLAMTAAILGVIPCCPTNMCCLLTLPVGIWALMILNKPEIKSQFT
jgi:hypothetical protein